MKRRLFSSAALSILLFAFPFVLAAQTEKTEQSEKNATTSDKTENLLEKVDLGFFLTGEPTIESVGFDHRKSSWKVEYELVLTDDATLEKLGRCKRQEDRKFNCLLVADKSFDKKIRRVATRIAKGKFARTNLSPEANREIMLPVSLTPETIEIFNRAAKNYRENPTFVLFVKSKIRTKTAAGVKFKEKFSTNRVYPLKFYLPDNKFDFWNVARIAFAYIVSKDESGRIRTLGTF